MAVLASNMGELGSKQAELQEAVARDSSSFRFCLLNMCGDLLLRCLSSSHRSNKFFSLIVETGGEFKMAIN